MLFLAVPRSSPRNESFHRYLNSFVPFLRRRSASARGTEVEVVEDDDDEGEEGGEEEAKAEGTTDGGTILKITMQAY